jgi:tyrosyl-tRNA synthetase
MSKFDEKLFERINQSWEGMEADEFIGFLRPKIKDVLTEEEFRNRLKNGGKLRVKFGIDPTARDIHLGHIVPILVLRQFVQAGHHVDFIIGDFTARIGDPSGRDTARTPLTTENIVANQLTYQEQIGKYLDMSKISVHKNSDWLLGVSLDKFFAILQSLNLAQATQREDFRSRARNQQGVSLAEVCYGVLMGIDSVQLNSDIEIGGIDQLLNFQQCRTVMSACGLKEEVVLTTPILEGIAGDGKKMSKSYGNYIAVNASLEDKFGKIMSIPDRLILDYFCLFTLIKESEVPELKQFIAANPLEAKKQLATLVVAWETSNLDLARSERERFERKFSERVIQDEDITTLKVKAGETLLNALFSSGKFNSRSELRRLFSENAIKEFGQTESVIPLEKVVESAISVRAGRRKFFKVIPE